MNRSLVVRLLVLLGVVALFVGSWWLADHFPQRYAHHFYIAKAVVGCVAVLITVLHMDKAWDHLQSGAQMARYLALFFGTVVAGASSIEQIHDRPPVELRNIGGMEFLIVVAVVMAYSLHDELRTQRRRALEAENRSVALP